MAWQHSCSLQVTAACRKNHAGRPRGKRCMACGGAWSIVEGRYGAFEWTGDGRYRAEDAIGGRLWQTQAMAERRITDPARQCVRFMVGA